MAKSEKTSPVFEYNESSIKSLDWREHIRLRPGMYIGKLGDGSSKDDGIYVLVKEVVDNCIDEHMMGYGKTIDIKITPGSVTPFPIDFMCETWRSSRTRDLTSSVSRTILKTRRFSRRAIVSAFWSGKRRRS